MCLHPHVQEPLTKTQYACVLTCLLVSTCRGMYTNAQKQRPRDTDTWTHRQGSKDAQIHGHTDTQMNKTDTQAHRHSHTDAQTRRHTDSQTYGHTHRQHEGGGLPDASPATPGAPVGSWKGRCDLHQLVSSEPHPRPQLPLQGSLREYFTTKRITVMILNSVLPVWKTFL